MDRYGFHAFLAIDRFSGADIEDAVRSRVLVPHKLPFRHRMVLQHGRPSDRLVARAVQLVERDEMRAVGMDTRWPVIEAEHNLEIYTGLNAMLRLLIGTTVSAGGTNYANGSARLCVGDGNGSVPTAVVGDTDLTALTGATHRQCNACDATYPSVPSGGNNAASAVLTAVSTVATGSGNFEWREWGMDKGGASTTTAIASGDLFSHRGVDLGLKTSAAAWALSVTFTQS